MKNSIKKFYFLILVLIPILFSCNGVEYQANGGMIKDQDQKIKQDNDRRDNLNLREYVETKTFKKNKPLDILIVIDNSASMQNEQQNLIAGLPNLLKYIEGEDWQIGVISTSATSLGWITLSSTSANVKYNAWTQTNYNHFKNKNLQSPSCIHDLIKSTDSKEEIENHFSLAINAGLSGSGNEQGILQAVNGLKNEGCETWVRNDSILAVLIVTDEDNNGNEHYGCSGTTQNPECYATYLTDYLKELRPNPNEARVYGIIPADKPTSPNFLKAYKDALEETGTSNIRGLVSATSFNDTLEAISNNAAQDIATEYDMDRPIDQVTKVVIKKTINGQEQTVELTPDTDKYEIKGRKIKFKPGVLPSRMDSLIFEYNSSF